MIPHSAYVLLVFCLFVILLISRFRFEGGIWVLVAPVSGMPYLLLDLHKIMSKSQQGWKKSELHFGYFFIFSVCVFVMFL